MSGFRGRRHGAGRGRGGGGGGGGRGVQAKGLFVNGVWHCDCNPRLPAVHFEVKKDGPNKGKWFRSCQKQMDEENRCKFFLWDSDAHGREVAALSTNTRTEPDHTGPVTPSRRQVSPPPPYAVNTGSSEPNRKRRRSRADSNDEFGLGQTDDAFQAELNQVLVEAETPSKVNKTSEFATPSTRRKLPWQTGESSTTNTGGLQTPQTAGRINPFVTRFSDPDTNATLTRVSEAHGDLYQNTTPSSSVTTPTPNRFRNVAADEVVQDVFNLLQSSNVRLDSRTEGSLKDLLLKHAKSAEGYKRGRDVIRTTVKAKEAKITELTYRVSTLEAELEAEKAMVRHLQWEAGSQPDTT